MPNNWLVLSWPPFTSIKYQVSDHQLPSYWPIKTAALLQPLAGSSSKSYVLPLSWLTFSISPSIQRHTCILFVYLFAWGFLILVNKSHGEIGFLPVLFFAVFLALGTVSLKCLLLSEWTGIFGGIMSTAQRSHLGGKILLPLSFHLFIFCIFYSEVPLFYHKHNSSQKFWARLKVQEHANPQPS